MLAEVRVGGTFDSEGSFTLGGREALRKLAFFQLPRQSAWVLKIVQAAVRSKASALRVSQEDESTSFVFQSQSTIDAQELVAALLSPEVPESPILAHLVVALRAVGFGEQRCFSLALSSRGKRTLIGWNGDKLLQREEHTEPSNGTLFLLGVSNTGEDGNGPTRSERRVAEQQELLQNSEVCPIPITFNGKRIGDLSRFTEQASRNRSLPLSIGWSALRTQFDLPALHLPAGLLSRMHAEEGKWRPTDRFEDNRVFYFDGNEADSELTCIGKLSFDFVVTKYRTMFSSFQFKTKTRKSQYCWVKDGVVVHRQTSGWEAMPISFDLYLSAEDLPSDISSFGLQESPELQRRRKIGVECLSYQCTNTLCALDGVASRPTAIHSALYGAWGLACLALVPTTLGKSGLGLGALYSLAGSVYDRYELREQSALYLRRLVDQTKVPSFVRD